MRRNTSLLLLVFGILLLSAAFGASSAHAGAKPSVENCEAMGMLDISCFTCKSGDYLGKISVKAEFDREHGDCGNRYREARRKCSEFYGTSVSDTAARWSHSMGGTTYSGSYPASCKK